MNSLPSEVLSLNQSISSLLVEYAKITDSGLKASYKAVITAKLSALQTAFNTYFSSLQSRAQ